LVGGEKRRENEKMKLEKINSRKQGKGKPSCYIRI